LIIELIVYFFVFFKTQLKSIFKASLVVDKSYQCEFLNKQEYLVERKEPDGNP